MTEHLELEIASTMAFDWVHKYLVYCQTVKALTVLEHALGKTVNSESVEADKLELVQSSDAIMAMSITMDFQKVNAEFPCLHRRMFYLGIAFITNSKVMETCQEEIDEEPDNVAKKNYLYVVNEEQACIHEEMIAIHQYLSEKENVDDSQTETQSTDTEG